MFQAKEIWGSSRPPVSAKLVEQSTEKKKGLSDWMNIIKSVNEEKDHWVPDEAVSKCTLCGSDFGAFNLRHHCRNCGDVFCDKCTQGRIALSLSLQRRMLPKSVSSTGAWQKCRKG